MDEFMTVTKEAPQIRRKHLTPFTFPYTASAEKAASNLTEKFSVHKISAYNIGRVLYVAIPKNKAISYLVRDYISTLGGKTSW